MRHLGLGRARVAELIGLAHILATATLFSFAHRLRPHGCGWAARSMNGRRKRARWSAPAVFRCRPSEPNHRLPVLTAFQSATTTFGQFLDSLRITWFVQSYDERAWRSVTHTIPVTPSASACLMMWHVVAVAAGVVVVADVDHEHVTELRAVRFDRVQRRRRGRALVGAARSHQPAADLEVEPQFQPALDQGLGLGHVLDRGRHPVAHDVTVIGPVRGGVAAVEVGVDLDIDDPGEPEVVVPATLPAEPQPLAASAPTARAARSAARVNGSWAGCARL